MSRIQPGETPLYLHITATSKIVLDNAVKKIHDLINQELGPLLDERTMIARNRALGLPMPQNVLPNGRQKWPEDKLFIGLDSLRNFNVRAKTVGPGVSILCTIYSHSCPGTNHLGGGTHQQGMFVKYIQAETGARVQIKGIGSGFMEADTGREAEEPMHINIA